MQRAAQPAEPAAELEWIEASKRGDGDAFGRLVRQHQQRVFRLAGRFFRRREDVEDVAQETFLTAWRKLDTYAARAPFEHWLSRICLRLCYARLRRKRPDESAELREVAAGRPDPDAGLDVERLLAHLAPADRMVLVLLDGEGWSTAEIARRLGWTRVNVKVRAHRARARLRKLVEQELPR